jgi:phage gp36-like protein
LLFGAKTPELTSARFGLRLQDLLKNTDESHVDYDDLSKALKMTQEVADYLNERYFTPFHVPHNTHTHTRTHAHA